MTYGRIWLAFFEAIKERCQKHRRMALETRNIEFLVGCLLFLRCTRGFEDPWDSVRENIDSLIRWWLMIDINDSDKIMAFADEVLAKISPENTDERPTEDEAVLFRWVVDLISNAKDK